MKGLIGLAVVFFWLVCALAPTVAIVYIAVHFIRKFW